MATKFCKNIPNKKCEINEDDVNLGCLFCFLVLIESHLYEIKRLIDKNVSGDKKTFKK